MKEYKPDPKNIKARNDHIRETHFQYTQNVISRRDFLRFATALGGGAFALGLLSPLERLQVAQAKSRFAAAATPQRGGTIHNALGTDTKNRFDDPAKLNSVFVSNNIRQICDYLVVLDPTLTLQPSLATSWMPSRDGLTWTVKLREGVKFNHGKTFNADDVVFTFKRLIDPATASGWAGAANYVTGVEKVDDNTVNFHTKRVAADFIYSLFLYHAAVLPADWPGDFIKNPWGTGPFTLDQFTAGELVRFKRRDYWQNGDDGKPLPYIDTLEFDFYTDMTASFGALQEGSLDMAPADVTLKDQYTALGDYNFLTVQTGNLDDIIMQFNQEPWTKPQMVEAFRLMFDRDSYVKTRFGGFAIPADDQPIAPGMYPLSPSSRTPRKQDYAKVKALLAEAGYPNGIDLTLRYIDKASDGGYTDKFAQFLVGQAEPAGIRLTLKPDPKFWDTWLNDWGPNTIGASNWAQKNTASEMFNLAYYSKGVWNETHWVNKDFDALLEKFDSTLDEATRKTQMVQLCDMITNQGSVLIPAWRQDAAMIRKSIHYTLHPQAFDWFGNIWTEKP